MNIEGISELQEIYRSKNSIVWTGTYTKNGKKAAIKMLNDDFPSSGMIARFNEEAELSDRFDIEGVRKIYEKRKEGNKPMLVMEYVEGASLQDMLKEIGRLETKRFLELAIGACHILGEVHRHGIIHKDINPRNLLVSNEGKVYVIDFGIASLYKRETQRMEAPEKLEGTLAYISPEQTGRVNHSVDSRSDLYSLGVTFYEMATGALPFETDNAMELVHSHIAKIPASPTEKWATVPPIVSKIVMKALAKNVEERYQTAEGMRQDLQRCLDVLARESEEQLGKLDFPLGSQDFNTVFQIPEKLYGREHERQQLLDAFVSTEAGGLATLTVGGLSGIGKTALIRELYKPVTEKRSYFLSGKFEQFQRDVPYSAIITAINGFVQQLLGESDRRLAHWRREIMEALGSNAGVLTELIPSLELIIGSQPAPVPLPPVESQNRFSMVFQKFFKDLSIPKHSLVLFIDDWQWADLPSLNLLKGLMTDIECKYLLCIAAYRSNEVDENHPFKKVIEEIRDSRTPLGEIHLAELETRSIVELLEDTFNTKSADIKELAQLIKDKTSGNPFFVTQFLQNLYEQGHISYDYKKKAWDWELKKIQALPLSSNVLDLMASRLSSLEGDTLDLLRFASCIGSSFSLKLLADLAGITQLEAKKRLNGALEQGFIIPDKGNLYAIDETNEDYGVHLRFLHDRVEQAVNQTVAPEVYAKTQWKIGNALLGDKSLDDASVQENLFEIVNYLNNGRNHIETSAQKDRLAELNYRAGKKAKRSNAYGAAHNFFAVAIECFGEIWQRDYEKGFDLYKEAAEAAFLGGRNGAATRLYESAEQHITKPVDKARLFASQILQLKTEAKFIDAFDKAIEGLRILGIDAFNDESKMGGLFGTELGQMPALLDGRQIEDILDAPEVKNDDDILKMVLLGDVFIIAYVLGKQASVGWAVVKATNEALKYGNSELASQAYATFALLSCAALGDLTGGAKYGKVAMELSKKYPNSAIRSKVHHIVATTVNHWTNDPKTSIPLFELGAEYGAEGGEFEYAGFATTGRLNESIRVSKELNALYEDVAGKSLQFMRRTNPGAIAWAYTPAVLQPIKHLLGKTKSYTTFDDDDFSEEHFMKSFLSANFFLAIVWFHTAKIRNMYVFGLYSEAYSLIMEKMFLEGDGLSTEYAPFHNINAIETLHAGIITVPLTQYIVLLTLLAKWEELDEAAKETCAPKVEEYLGKLRLYAENCPWHYVPKLALAEAEYMAYITGDEAGKTIDKYREAITQAYRDEDLQQAGIACERFAHYWLHRDTPEIAKVYFQQAFIAFSQWGALGKVEYMKEKYKDYINVRKDTRTTNTLNITATIKHDSLHTTSYGDNALDLLSVMKASQAISQEIKLDLLLKNMVSVLMENAGAERALLIHDQDGELLVAAEARTGIEAVDVLNPLPLSNDDRGRVALSIIRQVYRKQETVVTNNAKKDSRFAMDLYIQNHEVKSILCLPIMHQGKVRMVIYMEHDQIEGAFTSDRVEILNMLSSQVAISVENSVLYDTMEQKVAQRTAELAKANEELVHKNNNITASIKYALRMQQAILPTDAEMTSISPDHFVLYLPKDIVSGDFYWYAYVRDRHVIAAIDCTGHGVPGAFMSMIANTLLDEIVNQKETVEPAEILELLHKGVGIALSQDKSNNNDGMDMTLCTLEKLVHGQYELVCVGAKNSMFYVKNGEFGVLEADRRSIGGEGNRNVQPFTNQRLDLQAGDVFYLTTDGYVDQAGGIKRVPFSKKRLMEYMKEHWQKKMIDQKAIFHRALQEHQGTILQRDDITLMGFRLV